MMSGSTEALQSNNRVNFTKIFILFYKDLFYLMGLKYGDKKSKKSQPKLIRKIKRYFLV